MNPVIAPTVRDMVERRICERLRDETIANLDETYDLAYVNYDDRLTDTQIDALVRGDFPALWDESAEWEDANRHNGALYYAETEVRMIVDRWNREDVFTQMFYDLNLDGADYPHDWTPDGGGMCANCSALGTRDPEDDGWCLEHPDYPFPDYDDLYDDFRDTEFYDEVVEAIKDRDSSDPYKQLAHQSGRVLMRQVIGDEDHLFEAGEEVSTADALLRIAQWADIDVLPYDGHNIEVVHECLREAGNHDGRVVQLVYAVDVGDLYDLSDCEYVEIVNPHLYLSNPWMGDGHCAGPLHGTFRVKRADLTTDKGAWGYGWDEVAGVVVSAYEAEIRAVPKEES